MPSSLDTIEDKKKRYSREIATYTLRQWEIFHNQSAQARAEQERHDVRKPPSNPDRSRGGQIHCWSKVEST